VSASKRAGWFQGTFRKAAKIRPVRGKLRLRILTILLLLPALNNLAGGQRLPTNVVPSHYKLWIDPNIEKQQFSGEETIDVQLAESSTEIVLNSFRLSIVFRASRKGPRNRRSLGFARDDKERATVHKEWLLNRGSFQI
jgi:hypothetical protein